MTPLIAALGPDLQRLVKAGPLPVWIDPMLATPGGKPFSDQRWVFEQKYDGERCITYRAGGQIRLYSRNRVLLNQTYPEIARAMQDLDGTDCIVDGELVALHGEFPYFPALQRRMRISTPDETIQKEIPILYIVFDLLYLDGYDLTRLPLLVRKALLRTLITSDGHIRFSGHREGEGEACFRTACRIGLEGIIAKRSDSCYLSRRSTDWLKFTCQKRQEFVIGGYTDQTKNRSGLAAILVGYYQGPALVYAGKVGTGLDEATVQVLLAAFHQLEQQENPFEGDISSKGIHFTKPVLVTEIGFTGWTPGGKLRHPHFLGIRSDKAAHDVVREDIS